MFPHSPALVGFGFSSASFAALAIALLPQAAARFASITFSTVDQCGNFTIQFAGGDPPDALPLSLAILPLNGTPISIPLPLDVWNSTSQTGAAITFLPYPANTQFIASLDDANGQGAATVSDVLVINPSKSADASCLPTDAPPFAPQFSLNGTLAQCKSFTVDFDASKNISSPTIRAVVPKGVSSPVRETEANATGGVDTYLMDVPRDSLVLLQLTDSKTGHSETTTLLPVLGDINSDSSCIPTNPLATATSLEMSNGSDERVTPKVAIIVISVAIGVIALVAAGMIAWYFFYRRKAQQARKFTKLDEAASPSSAPPPDPEKQMPPVPLPVPPRIITTTATAAMPSPLSPADSGYAAYDQFVQNPSYIRMGSTLITPTSPDAKDPFGERPGSSLLGPLSAAARDSASSRLGATALGNNRNGSSTLALAPRSRMGSRAPSPNAAASSSGSGSPAARQSSASADLLSDKLPGTSPYWGGRLAVTPDNSLASLPDSILRKHTSARSRGSTASVSSVEIDRILEMATIYSGAGADDDVELPLARPQPAVTAPATLRSSAYMAGRESRRQSVSSPVGSSPTHSRNNSNGAPAVLNLNHSGSHSTLRLNRAFRDPPLATLPSSPLPSPGGGRPSFSFDGPADRDRDRDGRASRVLPRAVPPLVGRNATASTRGSVYSQDVDPARRS